MEDRSIRLLLVDDDEDDYIITQDLLDEVEDSTFDVEWVSTYDAALEAIAQNQYDICLFDYRLGEHNGLDLLRQVVADGYQAPIILLTGQGDREIDLAAMKAGASDYLVKGRFDAPLLGRSIRYAIGRAQTLKELRRSKVEVEQQNARMRELYHIGQMVNSTLDTDAILDHLTDEAMRVTNATHGQVLVVRKNINQFERRSLRGFSEEEEELALTVPLALDQGVNGRAYATRQVVCIDDGREEPDYFPLISSTRAELAVPIVRDGQVLGNLDLQGSEVGAFANADLDYLNALADQVAIALANAQVFQEVEQARRQWEVTFNAMHDAVVLVDENCLITQANAAFLRITQKSWQELESSSLCDDIPGMRCSDTDCPLALAWKNLKPGKCVHEHNDQIHEIQAIPISYGRLDGLEQLSRMIYVIRDVTAQKAAEQLLRLQATALESAANAIAIMSYEGSIEWINPAYTKLTGHEPGEVLDKHMRLLRTSKQDTGFYEDLWDTIRSGRIWHGEIINRRKDGGYYMEEMTIAPVRNEKEEVSSFVAIKQDVSDRKRTEIELQKAKRAAEEASRSKSEFLANMSHEIRTPMNGIIGMTELALGTELTDEQREYLSAVQSSADALLDLLNDILDFSKIEAGRLELEEIDFKPHQIIEQVADALAQRAYEKKLEMFLHVHPDIPARVSGDPLRLRQVLVNLVGNAIKFTDEGEIIIQVEKVRETGTEIELLFSVSDTGIGIPKEKQMLIFESFTQADGSTTRQYGGTGLGLTISKQLVEMMGGRIWVESEEGKGSTFYFTTIMQQQPNWVEMAPPELVELHDLRTLIIDDSDTNRQILRQTLHSFGCRPEESADGIDGLEALEQMAQTDDPYKMVLLDVQMPGMDGLEVLNAIRNNPELRSLVVIMLTSVDGLGSITKRKELGWSAYLTKPVKQSQLLDTIMNAVGKSALEEEFHAEEQEPPQFDEQPPISLRVLLAEDNQVNRRLATVVLQRAGHQVIAAEDGHQVLELLKQNEVDLIFMDVQMPEMDGLEATAAIRADSRWAHIPVVAMTAHAMKGDRERFLAAGMDDYVSKPIRSADVLAAIERQLDRGEDLAQPRTADEASAQANVLDRQGALDRLGADEALFDEFMQLFLEDAVPRVDQIAEAIQQNNAEALEYLAHSMKGGAASMGANRVRDVSAQLETMAHDQDISQAPAALEKLRHEMKLLLEQIDEEWASVALMPQ